MIVFDEPPAAQEHWSAECFTATVQVDGCVTLAGELDISGINALRAALDQALSDPGELIAIDAVQLSFIDSYAIAELLRYQLAAAVSKRLVYVHSSQEVAEILDLLDLTDVLMPSELSGRTAIKENASCSAC